MLSFSFRAIVCCHRVLPCDRERNTFDRRFEVVDYSRLLRKKDKRGVIVWVCVCVMTMVFDTLPVNTLERAPDGPRGRRDLQRFPSQTCPTYGNALSQCILLRREVDTSRSALYYRGTIKTTALFASSASPQPVTKSVKNRKKRNESLRKLKIVSGMSPDCRRIPKVPRLFFLPYPIKKKNNVSVLFTGKFPQLYPAISY